MSTLTGTNQGFATLASAAPDDGTTVKASDVNVPFQTLLDNDAYFDVKFGLNFRLIATYEQAYYLEDSPPFNKSFAGTGYSSTEGDAELKLDIPNLQVNDIVDVSFCGAASIVSGGNGWVRMSGKENATGSPSTFLFTGCATRLEAAMNGLRLPLSYRSRQIITQPNVLRIYFEGRVEAGGSPTVKIHGPYSMTAIVYRKG